MYEKSKNVFGFITADGLFGGCRLVSCGGKITGGRDGVVIGIVAGAAAAAFLIIFFLRRRKEEDQ